MGKYTIILLILAVLTFSFSEFMKSYFYIPLIGSCIIYIIAKIIGFIFKKQLSSSWENKIDGGG